MHKRNLVIVLLAGLVVGSCATSGPQEGKAPAVKAAPYVEGSAKVYQGADGIKVAMVQLEDATVIVLVSGVVSRLAGKALPCKMDDSNPRRIGYETQIDGRDYWVVRVERRRGSAPDYHVHLPDNRALRDVPVVYDEALSKAFDPKALIARYEQQASGGTIAQIARFKRDKEETEERESLAGYVQRLNEKCGTKVAVDVDWKSISDDMLKKIAVAGRCRTAMSAVRDLCSSVAARDRVQKTLKRFQCRIGQKRSLSLEGPVLKWTFAEGTSNDQDFARKYLKEQASWGGGENLAAVMWWEQAAVCTDGKMNYVGWHPERERDKSGGVSGKQVFFGDGKAFTRVPRPSRYASSGWFYDPRFFNRKHSEGFRGLDYRYLSRLDLEVEKKTCKVVCGTRTIDLKIVDSNKAKDLIAKGKFEERRPRVPHGLARDRSTGVYYFVDREGSKQPRDFRLYAGRIGKLKRMKMVNIVSDSKGDVFSTKSGSLRLVLEKDTSLWMRKGRKPRKLLNVPIQENLTLIYNELGPYLGVPFGTPCDVL